MANPPHGGKPTPNSSGNDNDGRNQLRKVSGEISIRGAVETQFPPKFVEEYSASSDKENRREDKRFLVESVTLFFVIVVAVLGMIQTEQIVKTSRITQASYDATTRPYLGIDGTPIVFDAFGNPKSFRAILKNDGSTPAYRVQFEAKVEVSGVAVDIRNLDHGELMVLPTAHIDSESTVEGDAGQNLQTKRAILVLYLRYSYHWRDKDDGNCEKETYIPELRAFLNQGSNCPKWEDIGKNNPR